MSIFQKSTNVPEHKQFFHVASASVFVPDLHPGECTRTQYVDFPAPTIENLPSRSTTDSKEDEKMEEDADFHVPFCASASFDENDPMDAMVAKWIHHNITINCKKHFKYSDLFVDPPKSTTQDEWFTGLVHRVAASLRHKVISTHTNTLEKQTETTIAYDPKYFYSLSL